MSTLGRNIAFPIYNGDGTSFHNLVIKKSTSDSIVMSLGDKVTGDVYYKDNTLECNMDEYILVDGVKYSIVNPPTIVREGLKSENGDLKGMTKYSFEFYHPMYMLGNMAFSDVAVTNAESMFKSHDRTFSWIGNLTDYVAKLNKNLQNTQFVVSISSSIDTDSRKVLSDVLSFTNNTIADALKTAYDTWHFPFVVDAIKSGEQYYNQGKRFLIQFGNPTREILDSNNQPFVFHFGKGVGLKNNSRTPRNNKIVTRVAGYGSEQNIPYGYPQIPWTGDPSATQTADGYPIYEGIVGGVVTKLVKHPFTRTHLMPSVYAESVRKKVDSAAADYDNTTPLVDYYDAPSTYPNPINLAAPKLDIVGIETIKPELGDMAILGVTPLNNDLTPASGWDDTMDDDGKYKQSYFKLTIPQLDFDVYACASITEEMKINMRSGACIGCTFDVQVDWDDYRENFFDEDGNFLPDGEQRDLNKYPKSNLGNITLVCKKDINTFGTLMPNVYQYPRSNDKFVILGISLPNTYITNAQVRLDDAMMAHMLDNNVYYYDYPLKFDEDFLLNNTNILSQIRTNTVLRFMFGNLEKSLYVKQITIKYGEGVLPKYDITLTDNIEVVLNQIGLVADDVSRLAMAMMQMNKRTNINITNTESLQRYVDYTIMPNLESLQKQIDGSQVTYFGNENPFDASQPYSDGKYVVDPTKFPASEWDDDYSEHDGDMFYNRDSGKGYEFTIIDNSTSPVVYGWQLIQDEDIIQALTNAQNAQDTADGKRRVFICDASHHTPNPPYDVGDLWVNVKYPYATGATYDDEILKCVVAKTADQTFNISDWSLANGYTAALRNFINGTYADNLQEIQTQIDGKAETWYQNTDPSTAWTTTALKNQHKGDIWHNSSTSTINGVKAGQDAIWNGTAWVVDETVPQSVYDTIDGKAAIYVSWGAWGDDLQVKDLFIPSANTTQGGVTYKANKVYRCTNKSTPTFQEIAYTDDAALNAFLSGYTGTLTGIRQDITNAATAASNAQTSADNANTAAAAAQATADALDYLKQAYSADNTLIDHGLILSTIVALRDSSNNVWSGISGAYDSTKLGNGIAAWYGGGMIDKEVSAVSNAAKSLFRFDGSGYVASGNLKWDANGNVTIQGYSINATTLQVGGSNVATQAMLDNFVSKAFFNRLFTAYDANGNAIVPNNTTTAINNLKIMVGTWTEQYLSALGLNSQGGGGTGDVSHIKVSTNPDVYLDPDSDGIIDMSDYVSTIAERNNWNIANANINRLMARVPSATFNTGNELADKAFVNSSISTATATFRGTVTASNDTDAAAATALATISTKDLNDYAFVKVENTPQTGVDKYKRYKYDGTNWVYEYTLNNSSFTSDQWSAINSGITQAIVSTIVPNTRSITAGTGLTGGGNLQADRTISLATSGVSAGTYRSVTVDVYGRVTAGTNPTTLSGYGITDAKIESGVITLGSNTITPVTSISKNSEGILSVVKGTTTDYIDLSHNHSYWEILDRPTDLEGFGLEDELNTNYVTIATKQTITGTKTFSAQVTANGLMLSATKKIYFGDSTHYIELDSAGFHFSHGIYSDSFVSALGANSSGGGGGGMSLNEVWQSLTNEVADNYSTTKIHTNHIPDMSGIYGYLKQSALNNYVTSVKVGTTAYNPSSGVVSLPAYPTVPTKVSQLTNDSGYVTSSGVTSITLKAGTGISLDVDNTAITSTGTRTITNSGVRAATINGNYLRVNTNGTNADLTIPYATSAGSVAWGNVSGKPTTVSGYGITDAVFNISRQGDGILKYYVGSTANYLDLSHNHSYWDILDRPVDLEGFGLTDELNALYVTALGTSGNYLTWTKNGSTSNITIPYATLANTATTTADTTNTLYVVGVTSSATTTLKRDTSITIKGNALSAGSITTTGNVSIGGALGVTGATTLSSTLSVASGITLTTTKKIYFGDTSHYLELNSTGFHFSHGVYSDSFMSALGANSGGGGGGDFNEEQMWAALQGNTGTYADTKINANHIPDTSSLYGYLKQSALSGYVTSVKVGTTAYNPSSGVVSLPAYPTVPTKVSAFTNDSGYVTSSGVTSVAAGTGLTGGTITSTGTVSISSTYLRYISNGNTAYEWGNHANAGYALASSLSSYLPLTGGTITGTINRKMSADTSNYEPAIYFVNVASGTKLAEIGYWNTAQRVYINPIGSSNVYDDAIGKYSLMIGNNSLTYNTYTIYHAGNSNTTSVDWSCQHLTIAGNESSNITTVWNGNGAITTNSPSTNAAIRHAIRFNWYSTSWEIGNIRDSSDGTHGFGITSGNSTLVARFTTSGAVVYGEVTATSDARQKTLLGDTNLSVKQIADAPNIKFLWNDNRDEKTHIGSLAQYWDNVLPEAVTKDGTHGYMSLNYGALALCSAITIARMTINHEDRITMLERENAKLKARVAELEERRIA